MAAELILVLKDFFISAEDGLPAAEPRLAALETLLATAHHRRLEQDWRAELAARFGRGLPEAASPARVVASALRSSADRAGCWLVTPVHYFAGLDSVHLHPAGLLELAPELQLELVGDFNREFGNDWHLSVAGGRELLLTGPAVAAGGDDPARWLGARLERQQGQGADGAELRRLSVEIEMWLHGHALNRRRELERALPVSGLWTWGAGPLAAAGAGASAVRAPAETLLYGSDTFASALWQLGNGVAAELPADFASCRGSPSQERCQVILYPTAGDDNAGGALLDFERGWLAPALAALRSGKLSSIELLAGGRAFRLRRLGLARFWRPRARWQEALT